MSVLKNQLDENISFSAIFTHELQKPLTIIKGKIDVLLLKTRSENEYIKALKEIETEVQNHSKIIESLQTLNNINASKYNFANVDLEVLVNRINQSAFELVLIGENFIVKGNETLLKIALENIVENAEKYGNNNPIKVQLTKEKNLIKIEFIDNGIGINKEELKQVGSIFYRSAKVKNIEGNGIGLYLVNKIVAFHYGAMQVSSTENEGTTVTLKFPI
jgi:two-component system, OmpR family, sensor histidine kinase ArlS